MNRGEVLLVAWPFSDYSGMKRRPAVVVQADFLNRLTTDTVLVQITGTSRKATTEVLLDPANETAAGLRQISYTVCNTIMIRKMGTLSAGAVAKIEANLRLALALP